MFLFLHQGKKILIVSLLFVPVNQILVSFQMGSTFWDAVCILLSVKPALFEFTFEAQPACVS